MNWMQEFKQRLKQERKFSPLPLPKVSPSVSVLKPVPPRILINHLTRDELIFCIRDVESKLGRIPAVIDENWSLQKLQKWLEHAESLSREEVSKSVRVAYQLIEDPSDLSRAVAPFMNAEVIALDTETTGLDPHTDRIRTIQIASEGLPVFIIDLFAFSHLDDLVPLRALLCTDSIKVFHNAKFDLKMLQAAGYEVTGQFFDTMLATQVLDAGLNKKRHSLQALAEDYLLETVSKEEQTSDWSGELSEEQLLYAARDAKILLKLWKVLKEALAKDNLTAVAKLEFDCVKAVAEMELAGIRLDVEEWHAYGKIVDDRLESCLEILRDYLGATVNLNSTQQLQRALTDVGIEVSSTARHVLAQYATESPVIAALLEYKRLAKLNGFIETLPKYIHSMTKRVHASYWQMGSQAGRFSCSDPNLQQVPRSADVRSCFIPDEGNQLVIADYSQIELRVVAEISDDERMIDAYRAGEDLHTLTAALVKNIEVEKVTKEDRQAAKAVNFGLLFGMGAQGLKNYAQNNYGVEMSLEEATQFRERFFLAYTGIAKWHKKVRYQRVREVRTLSGRRRLWKEAPRITELYNTPVQGTAADILKKALSMLPAALQDTRTRIIGCIHDEILLETPQANAARVKDIFNRYDGSRRSALPHQSPCHRRSPHRQQLGGEIGG